MSATKAYAATSPLAPADVELIRDQTVNEAYSRILKSDVRYRFVIDMASL
jgi:D-arabinose 1-dehydrogenase-like Zn-dependent alcohol dehydrogenase